VQDVGHGSHGDSAMLPNMYYTGFWGKGKNAEGQQYLLLGKVSG
jgi:hypothetical protein